MDADDFDRHTRALSQRLTRRTLAPLLGSLPLGGSLALLGLVDADAKGKKKRKRKRKKNTTAPPPPPGGSSPPPPPGAAVVASYCAGGGDGSVRYHTLGQPFIAQRGGRLDRAEVTVGAGPGGQYAFEIRDLNQGRGISNAPVLAIAAVTVPAITSNSTQTVTAQYASDATLTADDHYALVVRYLGAGVSQQVFQHTAAAACPGPGFLLWIPEGQTTFAPVPGERTLDHTVYVVP